MRPFLCLLCLLICGNASLWADLPQWDSLWVRYRSGGEEHSAAFALDGLYKQGGMVFAAKWEGEVLRMLLRPVREVELLDLELRGRLRLTERDRVLCNGFQTWSSSGEYAPDAKMPRMSPLARPFARYYGDWELRSGEDRKRLHSWGWTWIRQSERAEVDFVASLSESEAYSSFEFFPEEGRVVLRRDVQGWRGEEMAWGLFQSSGPQYELFQKYRSHLGDGLHDLPPLVTGWTSWYNYYTDINEDLLMGLLRDLDRSGIPEEIFQIDDGFQVATGDWLDVDPEKFPRGMQPLADSIHSRGMKAGLWLAPFICAKKSRIVREHPDWILKDAKGKFLKAGLNPAWGGAYYVLDFYQPGVQAYLQKVFDTVLQNWGFDLIKADFLFAAGIQARKGKTRARVMADALDLLRDLCGDRLLLGCGVPLGPAVGRVDYCRIGNDIHLKWEWGLLKALHLSERISTYASLRNTLYRSGLNQVAFGNDPDVFILREENNRLTFHQKESLFLLNHLLGSLVFTSDDPGTYDSGQLALIRSAFPHRPKKQVQVWGEGDGFAISFEIGEREYLCLSNLSAKSQKLRLPQGRWFLAGNRVPDSLRLQQGANDLALEPFQSLIFLRLKPEAVQALGGEGHIFPGSEVAVFEQESAESWRLQLFPKAQKGQAHYFYFPPGQRVGQPKVNKVDLEEVSGTEGGLWRYAPRL